jgi:rRNA maturation protein Nop10
MSDVELYECPECGGELYATDPDRYCIECHHNDRV